MQIIPFPAHYQSVYTNFDISSFSLISCNENAAVLHGKSVCFALQKSRFRNAKSKLVFFFGIIFTKSRRFLGFVIEFLGNLVFLDFIDEPAAFLVLGA